MRKVVSALTLLKRIAKIAVTLIILAIISVTALAETRNIYVGDIITLEISGMTEEEIRRSFQDFEITELARQSGGYVISIRTFTVGTHTVMLSGKELMIDVASTLSEIEQEGIYEGEGILLEPGLKPPAAVLFYISVGVVILSGTAVLIKKVRRHGEATPYDVFSQKAGELSTQEDNYLAELTYYFKIYLESVYNQRIIGKTSKEIMGVLKDAPPYILRELGIWMDECDMLKYSGQMCGAAEKHRYYKKLMEISELIEKGKTNEAAV